MSRLQTSTLCNQNSSVNPSPTLEDRHNQFYTKMCRRLWISIHWTNQTPFTHFLAVCITWGWTRWFQTLELEKRSPLPTKCAQLQWIRFNCLNFMKVHSSNRTLLGSLCFPDSKFAVGLVAAKSEAFIRCRVGIWHIQSNRFILVTEIRHWRFGLISPLKKFSREFEPLNASSPNFLSTLWRPRSLIAMKMMFVRWSFD